MRKLQSGFTMIELIIAIAIVGILSAVVLPKVSALQAHARIAKMQGALAAMKSAANAAHVLLLVNNYPTDYSGNPGGASVRTPDINMEGIDVVYVNGYPDATSILPLAGLTQDTDSDYAVPAGNRSSPSPSGEISSDAAHQNCKIIYTPARRRENSTLYRPTFDTSYLTVENCS